MAIASILHRISGIFVFLLMPFMLYFLHISLRTEESFTNTRLLLTNPIYKMVVFVFCAALTYHLIAGIRHLLMDLGFGEELHAGRRSAIIVIALSFISVILLGMWIW